MKHDEDIQKPFGHEKCALVLVKALPTADQLIGLKKSGGLILQMT
jgi:hypothetical protein